MATVNRLLRATSLSTRRYRLMDGVVKWFDELKGYGFIKRDGTDVFVHHSAIRMDGFKTLTEGQDVIMEVDEAASKGPIATVVLVD